MGGRPQPPVAGPRRAGHRRRPPGRDVRGGRLAHRDGQVRPAADRAAPRCAPASTRCPTRSTSGCCARRRSRAARAARGRRLRPRRTRELLATFRDLGGHDLAALLDGYRQADEVRDRPSVVFAYTIKGWSLPTEGHPANHSALLNAKQYRELAQQLGEDPDAPVERRSRTARRRPSCARRPPSGCAAIRRAPPAAPDVPARPRPQAHRHGVHAAGVRALLRRPRARGARRGRARRHDLARTSARPPTSAAGSTRSASGASATGSTGSPTTPTRSCAGASPRTASTSSWASPRSTSSARWASWAPPGRATAQPLLPVGTIYDPFVLARAGAVVVRHLRRRPVDPRGHAERRHARARGRRAPVGDHAVGGHRAARLRVLGAGVRPGLRVGVPARALPARLARTARPPTSASPRARSTRRCTPARARRRWPAATGCGRTTPRRS